MRVRLEVSVHARVMRMTDWVKIPVNDPDPLANCPERYVDEENRCQYRLRSDPTMCSLTGASIYCPCTCGQPSNYPANPVDPVGNGQNQGQGQTTGQGQNQNPHGDQNQIPINPNLCADVPDSKMEYDCQYRIAQDRQLCDDPSYRGMCRCTCARFGNAAAIQENASDSPPVPGNVLPLGYENSPERCIDYEADDGGRSCFIQVARTTVCSDELRVGCPCTCRLQDEGDLCPDSPWTPMAAICQMRFSEGRCHELRVREECPCTCAFVFVHNSDGETPFPSPNPGSHNEHAPAACIDTGLSTLCNYVVTHNMCASQYHFCKRTCNRCSEESLPDGNEPVVNLMPDVDHENERGSSENSTEDTESESPDDGTQEEPCFDSIYPGLCATYDMLGRCAQWWPYCRLTCEVCTFNPYLNPRTTAIPDYSFWDLSSPERCIQCQQYLSAGACDAIDQNIQSYCQTYCGSCIPAESEEQILIETFEEGGNNGNVPTDGQDGQGPIGDGEGEDGGVRIDGENVVHDNGLPGFSKFLLPPAMKLRQGIVFTHVCDSVHRGEGVSVRETSPDRDPPGQRSLLDRDPHPTLGQRPLV